MPYRDFDAHYSDQSRVTEDDEHPALRILDVGPGQH